MRLLRSVRFRPTLAASVAGVVAIMAPVLWESSQAPVLRGVVLPAMALVALAVWLARNRGVRWSEPSTLVQPSTLPILVFLGWAAVRATGAAEADFARGELLRLAGGVAVYLTVASAAREWERARRLIDGLLLTLVAAAVVAYVCHSASGGGSGEALAGAFGNRQLLAAFLLLLAPLAVAVATAARQPLRRTLGQVAAILALAALALTQTRSAWVGGLVTLAVLAVLLARRPRRRGQRRDWRPPLVAGALAVTGLGFIVCHTDLTGPVAARAATLTRLFDDEGAAWRLRQWRVALELAWERPLGGHGLGSFPLAAAPRLPDPIPLDAARAAGPNLALNAHSLYLQLLAETGVVGLGLYLWILVLFFRAGLKALRQEHRSRSLVLSASVAAIAGQSVDALANPAYQFVDVSLFFWGILGLGAAMCREEAQSARRAGRGGLGPSYAPRTAHPAPYPLRLAATLAGAGALIAGSVAGAPPPANTAEYVPLTSFRIQALTTPGYLVPALLPGECVELRATATMANGDARDVTGQCTFARVGGSAPPGGLEQLSAPHQNLFCLPTGVPAEFDGRTIELQGTLSFNGQTISARSPTLTLSVPRACPGVLVTATPRVLSTTDEMVDVTIQYTENGVKFQRLQRVTANEPLAESDIQILNDTHVRLRATSTVPCRRIYTLQYRFRDRFNQVWMAPVQVYVR